MRTIPPFPDYINKAAYPDWQDGSSLWRTVLDRLAKEDRHAASVLRKATLWDAPQGPNLLEELRFYDWGGPPGWSTEKVLQVRIDENISLEVLGRMSPLLRTTGAVDDLDTLLFFRAGRHWASLHVNVQEWSHEPTPEELQDAVFQLREMFPADRVISNTPTTVIDGVEMTPIEAEFHKALRDTNLTFTPQATLFGSDGLHYRIDFLVIWGGKAVAVEVDGGDHHNYRAHIHDTARDRALRARGIETIRFPGKLIKNDLRQCMFELLDCLGARRSTEA